MNHGTDLKQDQNRGWLFLLYAALTMAVYLLPAVQITVPYIAAGLLMLAFLPFAMMTIEGKSEYFVLLCGSTLLIFLFNFFGTLYSTVDCINESIRTIRFFMPTIWAVYVLRNCSPKQQKCLLAVFSIITIFILFKTMTALEQNPWITRSLAQDKAGDTPELRMFRMENVGGFGFSYMIGVVVLCLVWGALSSRNKLIKVVFSFFAIVLYYYIVQTMYTTLLLLTSVGVLLLLIFSCKTNYMRVLMILGGIVLIFFLPPMFEYLSGAFSPDSLLSSKFTQMHATLVGEGVDSLGARPRLIVAAVENWLKSPLLGGYKVNVETHSHVFTALETNGIIGLIAYLWCLGASYKSVKNELQILGVDTLLVGVVFLYVFVLSILNPIGYVFEIPIAAFFVAPVWSSLFSRHTSNIESTNE